MSTTTHSRTLTHFTPLRYPGGKGKLTPYVKRIVSENKLLDGEYAEPYAGGAAVALELLFHDYVSHIHINDLSSPVYAFWQSVLDSTDDLCRLIKDTPLTLDTWDRQKSVVNSIDSYATVDVGFALFFLNRTNRSGILNAGVIGGRSQSGPWKIDARYNSDELIFRIQSIARMKNRISITNLDAIEFLSRGVKLWPRKTLIYLDPPYYVKGRDLYYHFYKHDDHVRVANFVKSEIVEQKWIVSYDNAPEIINLYTPSRSLTYSIGYSARSARQGSEVMFFDDELYIPDLTGPVTPLPDFCLEPA